MTDSKTAEELAQSVAREIGVSPRTSTTPAGSTEHAQSSSRDELVEAINQVFALFRLNYANQFYAAWPDADALKQVKRLWLDVLGDHPPELILRGARHAIEHSDYLPTLSRMLESCEQTLTDIGLPSARDAYQEACLAPSPKLAHPWRHPAVYLAGAASDWFFLANNPEHMTWPVFRQQYHQLATRAARGETLSLPQAPDLPEPTSDRMTTDERRLALEALRQRAGL